MNSGLGDVRVLDAPLLGELRELVGARDASRDLVDEKVAMAVVRAREAGVAWGEISRVLSGGVPALTLVREDGPPGVPA